MTSDLPAYQLPPIAGVVLTLSILTGYPRRSLTYDSRYLLKTRTPRPLLEGLENFPTSGAFTLIANHHERSGLWIGWIGALVADALATVRQHPADPPIRIITTDSQRYQWRGRSYRVPLSRWFFNRVARFWGMIALPANAADQAGRAAALRVALRYLQAGEPLLLFPEGEQGRADRMTEALPGTGTFLALASRYAPILPAAFWEEGDLLRGRIGTAIRLTERDDNANRRAAMTAITELLPDSRRRYRAGE